LILANLASVDLRGRLDGALDRYFAPLLGPVLMLAATTVKGGAGIGLGRPELAEDVVQRLITVAHGRYRTPECRNLILGHAVEAIDSLLSEVADPTPVLAWVRSLGDNPRMATRQRAMRLLQHWR
jgi:hypothetical protein